MTQQVAAGTLLINDSAVVYVGDSLKFKRGGGDQDMRPGIVGSNEVTQIFVNDLASAVGMIEFEMHFTKENTELALDWKNANPNNVVQFVARTQDGNITLTWNNAVQTEDPEHTVATEGNISMKFKASTAI